MALRDARGRAVAQRVPVRIGDELDDAVAVGEGMPHEPLAAVKFDGATILPAGGRRGHGERRCGQDGGDEGDADHDDLLGRAYDTKANARRLNERERNLGFDLSEISPASSMVTQSTGTTMRRAIITLVLMLAVTTPAVAVGSFAADYHASKCAKKWPGDFRMQEFCITTQKEAWTKLDTLFERTTAPYKDKKARQKMFEVVFDVHHKCAMKWVLDYRMTDFCVEEQMKSYHRLRSAGAIN